MLIIKTDQPNYMVVTVSQNSELPNPQYLFSFVHIFSKERVNFIPIDVSTHKSRYDEFYFVEGSGVGEINFPYSGQYLYTISEQPAGSGNLDPALATNVVENGEAQIIVQSAITQDSQYEVFISNDEFDSNIIFAPDEPNPTPNITPSVSSSPTTPTPTPTITATPTITPTITNTPSITPTCATFTTQYLQVELTSCQAFRLSLWNDQSFTSVANAVCDVVVSGTAYGDLGTIYNGVETILATQHQKNFNLNPVLQPGECVSAFTVNSVAEACSCYDVIYNPITPTPTITNTPTITPTITPTNTLTPTPSATPATNPGMFICGTGSTASEACNNLSTGNTIVVYAQLADPNTCITFGCFPSVNCFPCVDSTDTWWLDAGYTIPLPDTWLANEISPGNNQRQQIVSQLIVGGSFTSC